MQDGDVLVKPAVEGTKRVLAAAVKAGVSRVVQTSSCAAIANGLGGTSTGEHTFTEADWSDPEQCEHYPRRRARLCFAVPSCSCH